MSAGLSSAVGRLAGRRVLIVGDLLLDEYLFGRPERLSREAAIPVLEFRSRRPIPGGAANPARNIVALGGAAVTLGIVGDDQGGAELVELLEGAGVDTSAILHVPERPTTLKTRVLAEVPLTVPQQLARIDRLDRSPLDPELERQALERLEQHIGQVDAVLCSDYRVGFLSATLIAAIVQRCRERGVLLAVDSQGLLDAYAGATLIRCNLDEASAYLGRQLRTDEALREGLGEMVRRLDAGAVIVTRGGAGFVIQGRELPYTHVPALPIGEVFDATGAGDTFIAVTTLALAAGLTALDAARIANVAAGLVVRHIGNAVVTQPELRAALEQNNADDT